MLKGPDRAKLNKGLLSAFPTYPELNMMLVHRLDQPLQNIVAPTGMPLVVFDVISRAEAEGWTARLVASAMDSNPGNTDLYAVAQELGFASMPIALQRTVNKGAPFLDMAVLIANLARAEGQVCSIRMPVTGGTLHGTGFLVGPDVVLTNHHVVERVIDGRVPPAEVEIRFDYKKLPDGNIVNPGTRFALHAEWLVDHSPPDPLDFQTSPEDSKPDLEHLDYALLRLAERAGDAPVGGRAEPGARSRGWITLPKKQPTIEVATVVFIVQHPNGEPLKIAVETNARTTVNGNASRVRHRTNTAGGSSGSPCFDPAWNLLALHHAGDPNFIDLAKYNQGVQIKAIRDRLDRKAAAAAALGK
jgi:hypothetical protein